MRLAPLLVTLTLALAATPAARAAGDSSDAPFGAADPRLGALVEESLAARAEIRQAEDLVRAERERVSQASALPDPVLTLGIQNDGFDSLQIGTMETSFYQVMVSQGLPWPGKRGLRAEVAELGSAEADANVGRIRLSTRAEVARAYLDLVLARERLRLADRLEVVWQQSIELARSRYEIGAGAQSDVLRAQLELNRIRQRRFALGADQRTAVQTLNRLRDRPLDDEVATAAALTELGTPRVRSPEADLADAEARSPELALAQLASARAGKRLDLARREQYPDFAVNAGVMPRGSLEPMWLLGLSVNVPLWSASKQGPAVTENEARSSAQARGVEAIRHELALRVAERRAVLAALLDTLELYTGGLLVQSQATAEATLAQYRVGNVPFAAVLEANVGYIGDEEGYLLTLADAHRVAIARDEVSLAPTGGVNVAGAAPMRGGAPTSGRMQPASASSMAGATSSGAAAETSGATGAAASGGGM
jgi:cobalt-zinc-cadmium efflux system outer membrane protein